MTPHSSTRRYGQGSVAPFPLPQDRSFTDACRQVTDRLYKDIEGFNAIILGLPTGVSALNRPELLHSAVQRPFTTLDFELVYNNGLLQAAALLYSLVQNHPFSDANKRTAYWGCAYFLQQCGYWRDGPFINRKEAFAYEQLILDIAREGDDIARQRRSERYTVEEIADRLDHALAGSRRRRYNRRRSSTDLWGWLNTFIQFDKDHGQEKE